MKQDLQQLPITRRAIALMSAIALTLLTLGQFPAWAMPSDVNLQPEFDTVEQYRVTLDHDPADIYIPTSPHQDSHHPTLPVVLLLQGANVDKSNYSRFSDRLARYGFIVVVPNHLRKFPPIQGWGKDILLPEQHQVTQVLDYLSQAYSDPSSPLYGAIDLNQLLLVGHSMGGLAGINAIRGVCHPPLCVGRFARPTALVGGVFYGTNLKGHLSQRIPLIVNAGIPIALIQGSLDGATRPLDTAATYQKIQDSPKALITIEGANHYGITNTSQPLNPPGIPPIQADPIAPTLDQAQAIDRIAYQTALFFKTSSLPHLAPARLVE
jgi:predicted dienelactone hydrolase